MRRKQWAALFAVVLLVLSAVPAAALTSSYHETKSEFSAAPTSTNLQITGSGDDAKLEYTPPDLRESTTSEFNNGTTKQNVTIANDAVSYDGLAVGPQHTTNSDFNSARTSTNVSVTDDTVRFEKTDTLFDDFETGDVSKWGSSSVWSASSARSWEGTYSGQLTGNDNPTLSFTQDSYTQFSASLYSTSNFSASPGMRVYDGGGTNLIVVQVDDGSKAADAGSVVYYDGAWKDTGIQLNTDTWYQINIKNIDYGASTFDIEVVDQSGSVIGTHSGANFRNSGSNLASVDAWSESASAELYYDYFIGPSSDPESGLYRSSNLTVDNAEQAAINLTKLRNVSATVQVVDADSGKVLNESTFTSTGNHTLTLATQDSSDLHTNVSFNKTGADPLGVLADESILYIQQATYQSQHRRAPEASAAYTNLTLPDTANATVTIEGYDGASWNSLASTTYTTTGNKSQSIGSGYEKYRTRVQFDRSAGGADGQIHDLGFDATKQAEYVGTNHSIENASAAFYAINISNAEVTLTVEGYDASSASWDQLNQSTFTSSVFDTVNISESGYDTYRIRMSASSTGVNPTAVMAAEGLIASDGTVVKEVVENTSDSTPFLLALSDSREQTSDTIITSLPLGALPDYYQARAERQIREILGLEESTTPQREATAVQTYYNDNSDDFTAYVNQQIAGDEVALKDYDTINITIRMGGNSTTVYWLGLRDGDKFATTTIENSTTRTVDQTLVLSGHLAVKSEEELKAAHDSFVRSGEAPSAGYRAALKAKYGPDVSGSLLNETTA